MAQSSLPLEGIRVLSSAMLIMCPVCMPYSGLVMGAEVYKVERPGKGDRYPVAVLGAGFLPVLTATNAV